MVQQGVVLHPARGWQLLPLAPGTVSQPLQGALRPGSWVPVRVGQPLLLPHVPRKNGLNSLGFGRNTASKRDTAGGLPCQGSDSGSRELPALQQLHRGFIHTSRTGSRTQPPKEFHSVSSAFERNKVENVDIKEKGRRRPRGAGAWELRRVKGSPTPQRPAPSSPPEPGE